MGLFDDTSNSPSLALSLGSCLLTQETTSSQYHQQNMFFPTLRLAPSVNETSSTHESARKIDATRRRLEPASSLSGALSSFSNGRFNKDIGEYSGGEEVELEKACNNGIIITTDEEEDGSPRKKLRLTKDQSAILEDSFKRNSTLKPKQKQTLAEQLHLRPRQVEVWFQNRRARTKLKQTEVECELLKKCCEALTEENKRLQREVQELKSLKATAPFYMQLPPATLSVCPSCERVAGAGEVSSARALVVGQKPQFYSALTRPSAAW